MSEKTKSSKYDQAVARARGETSAESTELTQTTTANPGALAPADDVNGLLVDSMTALASIRDEIKRGAWENAPQLLSIPEGKTLVALLEGNGPPAEFIDQATGEVSTEQTWILSKDGIRVSILGTVQLNKKLPPFVNGIVAITRGRDVRNGTKIYTEYAVAGPKRADGSIRNWAQRPQLAAPMTPASANGASEDLL